MKKNISSNTVVLAALLWLCIIFLIINALEKVVHT